MSDAAPASPLTRRERFYLPLAAAVGVAALFLTEPSVFRGTDFVKDWLPKQAYLRARLGHGELPLWTPYVGLGRPFLAAIDTGTLYPPGWLTLLLGPSVGVVLLTMAHFALAAVFLVKLGGALGLPRPLRWLSALAFLAGTLLFVNVHVGAVQYGWATCYIPPAFWLGLRLQERATPRGIAALALVFGLQLLCGPPQIAWIGWLGLGAFLLGRAWGGTAAAGLRRAAMGLGAMAGALLWAFLLDAAQLLPLFELIGQSNRARPTLRSVAEGSLEWHEWLSLVVPPDGVSQLSILTSLFVGAPILLAGLAGLSHWGDRNARGLAAATLLAALVAAGPRTPAFALLYHVVPGLTSFHFHRRAAMVVAFALALAAGLFLARERRSRAALAVLAAATAACVLGLLAWVRVMPGPRPSASWLAVRIGVILLSATLLALWHTRPAPGARTWSVAAVAVLVAADLAIAIVAIKRVGQGPGPFPAEALVAEAIRRAGLQDPSGAPPRIAVPFTLVRDNSGAEHGYAPVSGYVPLGLDRVWTYEHEALSLPFPEGQNEFPNPLLYRHGPFPYPSMAIVLGWDPNDGALRINRSPDPRAYVAGGALVVGDWHEAVRRMARGHDFHRQALVERPLSVAPDGGGGPARITRYAPEALEVEATSSGNGVLVLAEPWYPGWSARVNGAPAPCLPANGWMRAVPVPPGTSRVELRYRSTWLPAGAALSLLGAALLAVAFRAGRTSASIP